MRSLSQFVVSSRPWPAGRVATSCLGIALAVMLLVAPRATLAQPIDANSPPIRSLKRGVLPGALRPGPKRVLGKMPAGPVTKVAGAKNKGFPRFKPSAAKGAGGKAKPAKAAKVAKPKKDNSKKSRAFGVAPGAKPPSERTIKGEEGEDKSPDVDIWGNPDFNAPTPCGKPPKGKIAFNLRDAELYEVVRVIAGVTCKKFIIPANLKRGKKITIIAHDPITVQEAWRAFLSALEVNGMTVVPSGRFLKIAQSSDAKSQPVPFYSGDKEPSSEERLITRLFPLKHVDTQEISSVFLKLKSKAGEIIPYQRTNTLIITDYGHVVRRFMKLLKLLDVAGGEDRVWVYQVQYATASELSTLLLQVFEQEQKQQGSKRKTSSKSKGKKSSYSKNTADSVDGAELTVNKIIADDRTNQLIIIAGEKAFGRLMELINTLDVDIPGEGQVHVYYLKNADAEEISGVLSSLTSSTGKRKSSTRKKKSSDGRKQTAAELFQGEVKITADKATNALVVVASLKDYLSLINVVKKLDIRRPQVFVEAVVMEVNMSKTRELGLALHGGTQTTLGGETVPLLAGTNFKAGALNSLILNPSGMMGFAAALQGPSVELAGLLPGVSELPSFGVVLNALQTNDDVNILSTPHILTTDNEEAEIKVGQNVPFVSGGNRGLGNLGSLASLAGGTGGAAGLLGGLGGLGGFNIQRQDVALTLKLTPQINESDFVRLRIEQTIEELGADNPGLGPTTTKRSAKTVVVVKDQQTVVIGGLMRDNIIEGVEKVPFLGDIPVIGYLFRTTKKTVQKQNLMLLLTPYIIRDPSDFRAIFRRKMAEWQEFLELYGRNTNDPNIGVDYRKKHGLLQETKRLVEQALEEKEQIDRFRQEEEEETPLFREIRFSAQGREQGAAASTSPPADSPQGAGPEDSTTPEAAEGEDKE